jgi:hypothetical protein
MDNFYRDSGNLYSQTPRSMTPPKIHFECSSTTIVEEVACIGLGIIAFAVVGMIVEALFS